MQNTWQKENPFSSESDCSVIIKLPDARQPIDLAIPGRQKHALCSTDSHMSARIPLASRGKTTNRSFEDVSAWLRNRYTSKLSLIGRNISFERFFTIWNIFPINQSSSFLLGWFVINNIVPLQVCSCVHMLSKKQSLFKPVLHMKHWFPKNVSLLNCFHLICGINSSQLQRVFSARFYSYVYRTVSPVFSRLLNLHSKLRCCCMWPTQSTCLLRTVWLTDTRTLQ